LKILIKNLSFITIILILIANSTSAQIVYTPVTSDVYNFLERLSLKKIIEFHNEVLPLPRKLIADELIQASLNEEKLNETEKKQLEWYEEEYAYEMNLPQKQRWYLYNYSDSLFRISVWPVAGYGISSAGGKTGHKRWWGAGFFGTYGNWFGASLNLRDNGEYGDNVDRTKSFSPLTGAAIKNAPDGIEYTELTGAINFNLPSGKAGRSLGSISLVKEPLEWGHGKFGQLILSTKPPSYPYIRFDLHPVPWFRFYYIHGWLNSLVLDSSKFYYAYPNSISPRLRKAYHSKYIAANFLSVTPAEWLDLSLGNSVIYTGDLRPEFFIPFMFFKFLDHNTGRLDVEDSNGQMYFDAAVRLPETFVFYSTVFIDVTEVRNVLKNDFSNTWYGVTIGGKKIDLFIPNLDINIEYTRTSPWLYEHKDEVTTYKHLNYPLGDWLGQNADQLSLKLDYRFSRGLDFSLAFQGIRKGGLKDIVYAYERMETEPFLYGPVRKESAVEFSVSYEALHDLFGRLNYRYSDISDEDPLRTPSYLLGKKNSFSITVSYGL
jgi:hypothetical protein